MMKLMVCLANCTWLFLKLNCMHHSTYTVCISYFLLNIQCYPYLSCLFSWQCFFCSYCLDFMSLCVCFIKACVVPIWHCCPAVITQEGRRDFVLGERATDRQKISDKNFQIRFWTTFQHINYNVVQSNVFFSQFYLIISVTKVITI